MAITSGFFNSIDGDRKYDAVQLSSMFDGLIVDGVFASIGDCFQVTAAGSNILLGSGKAWFNHSWILNDSTKTYALPEPDLLLDRIDMLYISIGHTVRYNSIGWSLGLASNNPQRPDWTPSIEGNYVYPICYIYRRANTTMITQEDITNMIGSDRTPFVTGILQTVSLNDLLGQWESELDNFVSSQQSSFNNWKNGEIQSYNNWFLQLKEDLQSEKNLLDQWVLTEQNDFLDWVNQMKDQLGNDAAGNIQLQINKNEIKRILQNGFVDGEKIFSDDGTIITSIASDNRILTKTFTDGFLTMTTVLKSSNNANIAQLVKTFDSDGKTIDSVVTYY